MLARKCDGRRGRRVAAVAVEHDGDAEIIEEMVADCVQQGFAFGHVAAGNEQRGVSLALRRAREDGSVDHFPHVLRSQSAVYRDMIRATVISHDRIERVRDRIGIKLKQQFLHGSLLYGTVTPKRVIASCPGGAKSH